MVYTDLFLTLRPPMQLLAFGIFKWIHLTKSSDSSLTPEAYMPSLDLKLAIIRFSLPWSIGRSLSFLGMGSSMNLRPYPWV